MAIINTRSPFFVSITDSSISYATLDIEIYTGDKNNDYTGTPDYQLKKSKIGSNTTITFEISELIRDFLDIIYGGDVSKWVRYIITAYDDTDTELSQDINILLALQSYSYFEQGSDFDFSNKSLLMSNDTIQVPTFGDYSIPFYTDNNASISFLNSSGVEQRQVNLLSSLESDEQIEMVELFPQLITNVSFNNASDWTLRPNDIIEDGVLKCNGEIGQRTFTNFTPITGNQYIIEFEVKEVVSGTIAYYTGSSGQNISGDISKVGKYSYTFTQGTTTGNAVQFFTSVGFDGQLDNVSLKEVQQISKIKITDDNDIKEVIINEQCEAKYTPYKVTFINKFGVLQDMYFFKKAVEVMTTKRETYKGTTINNGSYSISDHTKRDFNIQANETIKLSSGYLNEEYNEVFKQMMLSEKVWLTDEDNNVLPINIKTSSINYKTSLNDKLVEYTIDFDRSYNVINNVR